MINDRNPTSALYREFNLLEQSYTCFKWRYSHEAKKNVLQCNSFSVQQGMESP